MTDLLVSTRSWLLSLLRSFGPVPSILLLFPPCLFQSMPLFCLKKAGSFCCDQCFPAEAISVQHRMLGSFGDFLVARQHSVVLYDFCSYVVTSLYFRLGAGSSVSSTLIVFCSWMGHCASARSGRTNLVHGHVFSKYTFLFTVWSFGQTDSSLNSDYSCSSMLCNAASFLSSFAPAVHRHNGSSPSASAISTSPSRHLFSLSLVQSLSPPLGLRFRLLPCTVSPGGSRLAVRRLRLCTYHRIQQMLVRLTTLATTPASSDGETCDALARKSNQDPKVCKVLFRERQNIRRASRRRSYLEVRADKAADREQAASSKLSKHDPS